MLQRMLYFDHNATTPLLPEARDAWLEASEQYVGNPSSPHRLGQRADTALQRARESLAGILGCEPDSIVWTSGATESNNMVFHHWARSLPPAAEVWVSAIEHPCVLAAGSRYFGERLRRLPVTPQGTLDPDELAHSLRLQRPSAIALMAANNETGALQPWLEVLALCRKWGIPFFCDAAQWLGKLPGSGLGTVDFVSGCAHKFGGPKAVGFLKCPAHTAPLLVGGPQENGRRAGTENVAGVLAMMAALEAREQTISAGGHEVRENWRSQFEAELLQRLPGAAIVAQAAPRLWNTVSALMPEADCQQRWVVKLDRFGYAVSTGSACASGKEAASHVLTAMGLAAGDTGRVLRFSSGWETLEADWHSLLEGLGKVQDAVIGDLPAPAPPRPARKPKPRPL
jgi:cysteine desulfurase